MRIIRKVFRTVPALAALALCAAAPLSAGSRAADNLLSLVPADAASVAFDALQAAREVRV